MTDHAAHDPATETAEAVAVLDRVDHETDAIKADARRRMGMDIGPGEKVAALRSVLQRFDIGLYPLVALSALVVVDEFQGYAFTVLTPEIAAALGLNLGQITLLLGVKTLVVAVASLVLASLVQARPRRAAVAITTGILWTVFTIGTGFVISVWGLLLVLAADGASTGSTRAVHTPLLVDHYPPAVRMRMLSYYRGADSFGNVLAPLGVFFLTAVIGLTWRGVFVGLGLASALGVLIALRLRDPGFGQFDEELINQAIAERDGDQVVTSPDDVSLGFFEIVRRVMIIPTVRKLLLCYGVLGVFLVPLASILSFYFDEHFNLDAGQRGLFFAFNAAVSIVALVAYGSRGESIFARDPRKAMDQSGYLLFTAIALLIAGTLMPNIVFAAGFFAASSAAVVILVPILTLSMFAVVPSRMRPHVAALIQIYLAGVGGFAGAVFLGGIESRFGVGGALISMLLPAAVGAAVLRSTRHTLPQDMDAMIADQVQEQEIRAEQARGTTLPMLACRGVDFSYGPLQVLFDIDFTVDDGEMVALLGTNGAGKSTLLRVISGTGLPQRGTVRFGGTDITYVDAERRVGLGITQVPGGRGVFGPLSVAENLRLYGYSKGKSQRSADGSIAECFEVFPRLAERRNQAAATLSGGEQQMLALSKALILRPRLLLIDELSLGLAPIIVGQLMEMVRTINLRGTSVVLVEQSVNVALELVDHAYFMEKGQIKFDGRADQLLGRGDLLRAVFLDDGDTEPAP